MTGYASSIGYHPNGQVNQIVRANGTTDTYTKDPQNQLRPNKIETKVTSTGAIVWSSGVYSYDGAGNVVKMGSSYFLHDTVSRIDSGTLYTGYGGGATGPEPYDHAYDGFGNLQSMTSNGVLRNTPTSSGSNRLTGSVGYDAAGALTAWNSASYSYDATGMMWRMVSGSEDWLYIYTADDERIWSYKPAANLSRWTLRGLDQKVLREYQNLGGTWTVQRDYVYRGSDPLAAVTPTGTNHLHPDHLGTVRAVTNSTGTRIACHAYFPFGEEATSPTQDTERMKFTGHERDLANAASAADDLDYMHARFYNPLTGRFSSVDPGRDFRETMPQSWNRYAFVRNDPLSNVDPDGRVVETVVDVGFIAYDLFDIGKTVFSGEKVTKTQWLALGADVVGAATPFATGGGAIVRGAAKADRVLDAQLGAFEIARQGGRHAGFLRTYATRSQSEISKGIKSLEKEVAEHKNKIADPNRALPGFEKLDPRQQKALLEKKWPSDIKRLQEQLEILKGLLHEKK